jgi:hypothetical protein
VAELADALDSKSSTGNSVWVRTPPPANVFSLRFRSFRINALPEKPMPQRCRKVYFATLQRYSSGDSLLFQLGVRRPHVMQPILKILISAVLIFIISEVAKRSSFFGALIASLPLVSILAMIWLWRDTHDASRLAQFSTGVFWLVLPSLVLFALLPPLLTRWRFGFPVALVIGCAAMVLAYFLAAALLKRFGIRI